MLRQVRLSEAGVENEDLGFNAESEELRIYFSKILNSSWLHGTKVRLNIIKPSKPAHRYGKVIEVIEDDNGLVRDAVVATRSRRRKEKPGQYAPGPMDHQLVAVQPLVLLLPKEQQDQLPAEEPGLHVCEETLQVPDHHEDLATAPPPPPSPTAPASQCAPDPTLDETVPLDPEVIAINSFVTQALSLQVNLEEQFYCIDCALLQSNIW